MTNRRWPALLALLVVSFAAACGGTDSADQIAVETAPAGAVSTEERVAAPFTRVSIEGELAVTVRQKSGAPERIEVTAPDGGHQRIVTTVDAGTIEVSVDGEVLAGSSVLLVVAELASIDASGGAALTIVGELDLPVFEVRAASGTSITAADVSRTTSGGAWRVAASGGSTVDLVAVSASAVNVDVSDDSTVRLDALTSVLGSVDVGSTLEIAGEPGRLDIEGGGLVRAMNEPGDPASAAAQPEIVARPDGLTGAPLPPPETEVVDFDEDRFLASAGTFPALTDPAVVPGAEATWLEDDTLVLGATQNGEARAYPIYMLRLHHVANDVLGGKPYLVTF